MLLPFPVLLKSQIQSRKKLVLLGLFALGIFITIIQIIRIQTIKSLSNYLDSSALIMWSTVENNLGIMVACVPTLGPLFKSFAEKSRSGYYKNTSDRVRASKYGMHSWRDADRGYRSGVHDNRSVTGGGGGRHEGSGSGRVYPMANMRAAEISATGGPSPEDSQERIWGLASSQITKKTDIVISRELRVGQDPA